MSKSLYTQITALPENSWPRQYAENAAAAGMTPIPMRTIPDPDFRLFAYHQQRTEVHQGMVCLPLDEFVRIAKRNASKIEAR